MAPCWQSTPHQSGGYSVGAGDSRSKVAAGTAAHIATDATRQPAASQARPCEYVRVFVHQLGRRAVGGSGAPMIVSTSGKVSVTRSPE